MEHNFSISDSASARINKLKAERAKDALRFRIVVEGGGCSGFQYKFLLDEAPIASADILFMSNAAEVVIDDISIGLLENSILDFTEDLSGAGFVIKNPNATAKCGCGNSFSVAL